MFKKIGQRLLKPFVSKFGFTLNEPELNQSDKNVLLDNFYICLNKIGFIPKHIVDIGANHGTWTRKALEHFPDASFTMLEPQEWLKNSFEDLINNNSKIKFFPVGAGSFEGSFKFTIVDRDDSCSFRYSEEEALANGFKQIEIPVVTINSLIKDNHLLTPDIVKIDAEGLDIEVIKGASNYFGTIEIFMVEATVMNKAFSNDVLSLIQFMNTIDYKLFDVTDLNRTIKDNALWLMELVFIKKNGYIDNSIIFY